MMNKIKHKKWTELWKIIWKHSIKWIQIKTKIGDEENEMKSYLEGHLRI